MPCLKFLYCLDIDNSLVGTPINISKSKLEYIYVNNNEMTKDDKEEIKKFKKSR
jgi:hypothetical protein